jgi:hypothetical protein
MEEMGAGHFIYIPATLLLGIVLGWIFGSRAALDAYRADLKRREERAHRQAARAETQTAARAEARKSES